MRRLILTLGILVATISVCVIGVNTVEAYTDEMNQLLQNAAELCEKEDYSEAAEASLKLEDRWVEIEPKISFFINHATVGHVGTSISRLYALAAHEDRSEFLAECRSAQITLIHITEDEKLSFWRIF